MILDTTEAIDIREVQGMHSFSKLESLNLNGIYGILGMLVPIFTLRDQRLGVNMGSAQGPTGLGKYLMRSPEFLIGIIGSLLIDFFIIF